MPYPNYHSARIKNPGLFARIIVLQTLPNGVMVYGGPLKTDPSGSGKPQAYRFPRTKFSANEAKKWLRDHDINWISFEPATGEIREALGQGAGVGGTRQAIGGADYCVCPKCGFGVKHGRAGFGESSPCAERKCPKCGTAMKGTNTKPANLKEQKMNIFEASEKSWATIDKSKLPAACFLWVEAPAKKTTWHLPIYEGAGGINPETGMYRRRGELNLNGLRAASAAISGARTGRRMTVPADVRARITSLLKTYKIGEFAETKNLEESGIEKDMLILSSLKEASIDKENKVIRGVVILAPISENNREYTPECMSKAVSLFEGIKAYLNHQKKKATAQVRDVRDLIGKYKNARLEEGKLKGDLHLLDVPYAGAIMSIAEEMPDVIGNSIHARGRYRRSNGKDIIEEIVKAFSVDLVTEPATTSSLFEEIDKKEEGDMDWTKATLADLRANRADIYESILEEGVTSRDDEVKTLTEERNTLKKENDESKVKQLQAEKSVVVTKLLKESGLPEEAQTDVFKQLLEAVEEKKDGDKVITVAEQVKGLIDDRKIALGGKKGVHSAGGEKTIIESGKEVTKEDFASLIT